MADTRISLLPAITGALTASDDVLCLVDTSAAANKKIALSEVATAVGLGNVNNTSDANKPISTSTQAALDAKQPLDAQLTTLATITAQQASDLASVSTFVGTLLNDADAATARTTLGVGTATDVASGIVELATSAEVAAGTDTARAITPAGLAASKIVAGTAIATTSGTAHDFTGIPSWVKRITVMFSGVSTSGASVPIIQLGDAGGFEASGYLSAASYIAGSVSSINSTNGFAVGNTASATQSRNGSIVLTLMDSASNKWSAFGVIGLDESLATGVTAGSKALSATLDRVRLTTVNGTDTFDAGSVNILYE